MQRYFDVVQTPTGDAISGALVSVFISGTTTLATLYFDNGVTPQANPVTTNSDGEYAFYAANGTYVLQITAANYTTETKPGVVLFDPSDSSASNNVQFLQAGTGAQVRSVQSKLRDVVSVKDFGAVGDGVADDTAAFNSALAAANSIYVPWGVYVVKNVVVGTHKSIFGNGSIFYPGTNATCVFKLTGFKPLVQDCYLNGSNNNLIPSLGNNGAIIVEDAAYPTCTNLQFVGWHTGLVLKVSAITNSTQVTKGTFTDLAFDTIEVRGIYIGPNVNSCVFDNIQMYVGQVSSGGLAIPKAGCIGFQIVSTGSLVAFGGHLINKVIVLESEIGFQLTDAQLTNFSQCIADSLMLSGYQCTGACQDIRFDNCLAGTCLLGFEIADTANRVAIDGAETILQGVVPPWGNPVGFFAVGNPFDISLKNTANVKIGDWFSDAYLFYADNTVVISFTSEDQIYSGTISTVAASTTAYLTPVGVNSTENPTWVSPKKGIFLGFLAQCSASPGVGESFSYTVRNEASDITSASISGASSFGTSSTVRFLFNAQTNTSFKLVTSTSASAANHRIVGRVRYFG